MRCARSTATRNSSPVRSSAWRPLSKKVIERMVREESLESLTENVLEYCEGDFIREYARLTKTAEYSYGTVPLSGQSWK